MYNDQFYPVPWVAVIYRFHCIYASKFKYSYRRDIELLRVFNYIVLVSSNNISSVVATVTMMLGDNRKNYEPYPLVTESNPEVPCLLVVDYKDRMTPVVTVGGAQSNSEGMFDSPYEVEVECQTGNIYVSGEYNNRVQVFDSDGGYLFKFEENMNGPCYVAFSQNKVFVSQLWSHCVLVYDLNGNFIAQFGSRGDRESQFIYPQGIAINEMNGDIYVCNSGIHRIQVLSNEFPTNLQFGQGILTRPHYIKLTNESIIVLSDSQPFLYSFTYNFTQTHNIAVSSISKHLKAPNAFCVDGSGNFIISDHDQDAIVIFNQQGELVHTITDRIEYPCGVTLDSKSRIILVLHHRLLIL